MRGKQTAQPYGRLGQELKTLRNKARESLADASAAVEIKVSELVSFEHGKTRPAEEVLLLLINHFKPRDIDALKLWKLAGYADEETSAMDEALAVYTDSVEVNLSDFGLTMSFSQSQSSGLGAKQIAKVGMSREHAAQLIRAISVALSQTNKNGGKLILPGDTDSSN